MLLNSSSFTSLFHGASGCPFNHSFAATHGSPFSSAVFTMLALACGTSTYFQTGDANAASRSCCANPLRGWAVARRGFVRCRLGLAPGKLLKAEVRASATSPRRHAGGQRGSCIFWRAEGGGRNCGGGAERDDERGAEKAAEKIRFNQRPALAALRSPLSATQCRPPPHNAAPPTRHPTPRQPPSPRPAPLDTGP